MAISGTVSAATAPFHANLANRLADAQKGGLYPRPNVCQTSPLELVRGEDVGDEEQAEKEAEDSADEGHDLEAEAEVADADSDDSGGDDGENGDSEGDD